MSFIVPSRMFTITENLLKIGPVLSEVVGGYEHFCRVVRKPIVVTLVIFGISELIFFKFVQNVAKILPLNIFNHCYRAAVVVVVVVVV